MTDAERKEAAVTKLRQLMPESQRVYGLSRTASGTANRIRLFIAAHDGEVFYPSHLRIQEITNLLARARGLRLTPDGISINGNLTDLAFELEQILGFRPTTENLGHSCI